MNLSLSVIIPAKNEELYINGCIEALKVTLQSFQESEIILVDNGSIDKTRDIAHDLGCKVINDPIGNISKLRNTGAQNAAFNMLAFLDADCLVHPSWAQLCLQHFQDHKIGIVGTRAVPDLDNATWVEKSIYTIFCGSVTRADYVDWLGTSNFIIPKELFFAVGGFNEHLETAEDVAFCSAVKKKNKKIYLEKRIDTIHLRESKSILELFRREFWRGKNSIETLIYNDFPKNEILSVLVPAIVFISYLTITTMTVVPSLRIFSFLPIALILLMPAILLFKKVKPHFYNIPELAKMYFISFIYISARTTAFAYESIMLLRQLLF